ncbi:glycosyltransferase family 2 protein [Marinitenerispora sediminis]|uniref:Glycosyl transferase n=1 Tax=Marinitenerispora sediminis TaxID=1931232 RepID=A0A368T8G0_9ACTN|nr:glycosyltransferase [Marinitenerispora sediminis]RCV54338.1 glycosyl transferase [Marinitenerispora sediminis]RCV60531.1 glycosyl transferase [Marinitenerispora sediminis]RCV61083.1 glycosyl transferase [Marinitenerispora sediminis]
MGNRPAELRRAINSVLEQEGVEVEVVVVGNGADLPELPDGVVALRLPENVGIPEGRNHGVKVCTGDIVLFLDDDGWYRSRDLARHVRDRFAADPGLGAISFRIADPDGGPDQRRHVPRLRVGDPQRSSRVTTFLGGASAIRRTAFEQGGGLPGAFFYAHEETDLAWRILDAGYHIDYDAEAVMYHPAVAPTRHADFYRLNARNRVWLARRNLPWPLAAAYLGTWIGLTVLRERSGSALRSWFAGFREGWRTDAGARTPIRWSTAWRMTRMGRPPII